MTPVQQWHVATQNQPTDIPRYFAAVGRKIARNTDTAAIEVSANDMFHIGIFGVVGAGAGYFGGKLIKKPVIGSVVGAVSGIATLFFLVNRRIPEANQS